ncbi:MAG: trehalose-phosphatase [Streptosporangiales bacterium]|nr:trehalose-phosphatase [Streptosporangiales bacterium]
MTLLEPRTAAGREGLAAIRANPRHAVIGLDFDGTLAPIVADPEAARAHLGAVPALRGLAPLVDSVVVVTGRPAGTAVAYGGFASVPGLVVLGQYGLERWEAGRLRIPPPPPGIERARSSLPDLLARAGAPEGVWVEDKGSALAVHTRRTSDPEGALASIRGPLAELAEHAGLVVQPGRMVLELRPPGTDKGGALRAFLRERAGRAVLFAGDDLGDLPAFDAVDALRGAGVPGVTVCAGSTEVTGLAERADLVVDGPEGVVTLLEALAESLRTP